MKTHCNQKTFDFQTQNSRKIVAHFNGGNITSDAGGLLLQQAERVTGIISQFADRTSAATMRANQLRLWFSSVAYTLLNALRRLGLKGTEPAKARCDTIRLKLLKIGAQIKVTVRKVWVCLRATRIEEFSGRCMKISTGFVPFGCDVESPSAATNRFFRWKLGNSARRTRWLKASALKIDQFSAGTTNQLRYRGNRSLQQDTRPRQ
jgi:hypothetical protein